MKNPTKLKSTITKSVIAITLGLTLATGALAKEGEKKQSQNSDATTSIVSQKMWESMIESTLKPLYNAASRQVLLGNCNAYEITYYKNNVNTLKNWYPHSKTVKKHVKKAANLDKRCK